MHALRSFSAALVIISASLLLSACFGGDEENAGKSTPQSYPADPDKVRADSRGKLTGEGGLMSIGGDNKNDKNPLGVNSFLWRATLDTLAFMPINSADPFGGTILTDWYEDPKTPGERFKINALILDKSLRADGIKISLFKQKLDKTTWRNQKVDPSLARKLEDTILTRARQLRVAQGK